MVLKIMRCKKWMKQMMVQDENEVTNEEVNVIKSSRIRKQRTIVNNDEIGYFDDEKDPDYISQVMKNQVFMMLHGLGVADK